MSSKQMAQKRYASERVQRMRHIEPALLCSYAGTAAAPVPLPMGMRTAANAVGRRHDDAQVTNNATEATA